MIKTIHHIAKVVLRELSAKPASSAGSLTCLLKAGFSFHQAIDTAEEGGGTSSFLPFPSSNNFHHFIKDDKVLIFFSCIHCWCLLVILDPAVFKLDFFPLSRSVQYYKRKTKAISIFCVPGTDLSVFLWAFFSSLFLQ